MKKTNCKKIKRNKKRKMIICISGGLLVIFLYCLLAKAVINSVNKNNSIVEKSMNNYSFISDESAETENDNYENPEKTTEGTFSEIVENNQEKLMLASSIYLDVKWISQYPELPTGCEITSLTTVLQYLGYNVSKTTMAKQYLETGYGSFFDRFVGNPFSEDGYGCMAQPIVNAGNKYFKNNNIAAEALNVSGSDFDEILGYVCAGNPVIIWNTMYMETPYVSESWYEDGKLVEWVAPEHCVVLTGYDLEKGVVYVSDPLEGIKTRNLSLFAEYYEAMYSQAVIIQR